MASTYPRWSGDHEPGFVHELARRLIGEFDVTVLCPHAPGALAEEWLDGVRVERHRYAPSTLETLVHDGGIVTNLRKSPWKWLLLPSFLGSQAIAAWRLIRRMRPDALHAHWLIPQGLIAGLLALCFRQAPALVVTSHGADLHALRAWPFRLARRFVANRAEMVTVVSSAMRDILIRQGVPPEKVQVEPMGVDLEGRFVSDRAVCRSKDEILFVGRLVEKKGLRYLIEALPLILEQHPTASLTVAGYGPEELACRALVRDLSLQERVYFLGPVPQAELPVLYRRAAVFVAPFIEAASGDQEGLGLVSIEAAGCGCPVVISKLSATESVLEAAPQMTGVAPRDVRAIAAAVNDVLSGKTGSASADALKQRFDWGARASAYAALLSQAINKRQVKLRKSFS